MNTSSLSLFSGIFQLSEYNSHEVYEKVDTLTLRINQGKMEGTLKSEFLYGNKPYQSDSCKVAGLLDPETGVLTLSFSWYNNITYKLHLKHKDGIYHGYYDGSGEWRDRWKKIG